MFTEDGIVPPEKHHLDAFWASRPAGRGECADMFVIKAGRIRQVFVLGLVLFQFSWGTLAIIVPGENSRELERKIAGYKGWATPLLVETMSAWVEDSDRESLTGAFLEAMPGEFRQIAIVERLVGGASDDSRPGYRLVYRVRGGEWQRDAVSVDGSPSEAVPEKRMGGRVINGEVAISFSVYVGGIRSLGTLLLPVAKMADTGMTRLNLFLHSLSGTLCEKARNTVLPEFCYCRHWGRGGFRLETIREVVAALLLEESSPTIPVLPLWFPADRDSLPLLKALDQARYTTDILFVDKGIHSGCLLLRNVTMEKATFVREKILREKNLVTIDPPVPLDDFLQSL